MDWGLGIAVLGLGFTASVFNNLWVRVRSFASGVRSLELRDFTSGP